MNSFFDCPACDESLALGAVEEYCAQAPKYSQVSRIVITECTAPDPFTNAAGVISIVADAIDNTAITGLKSKLLVVAGGVGEPEETIVDVELRNQIVSNRQYTLTAKLNITSQANYEFVRQLQCGGTNFRFWYEDLGGFLYGPVLPSGNGGGIRPSSVRAAMPKGEGRDDVQEATITLIFDSLNDPNRYASPFTTAAVCAPAVVEG